MSKAMEALRNVIVGNAEGACPYCGHLGEFTETDAATRKHDKNVAKFHLCMKCAGVFVLDRGIHSPDRTERLEIRRMGEREPRYIGAQQDIARRISPND